MIPEQPENVDDLKPHVPQDFDVMDDDDPHAKLPLSEIKERMYLVVRSLKKGS